MQGYAYTQISPVIFRDPSGLCIPGLNCPFPDESQPDTVYEYYGNYYTLADCQGDAVANGSGALCRPWFDEYEFITIEALELFLDALYQDIRVEDTPSVVRALPGLVDHLIACEFDITEWGDLADDRGHYETPFWNGRMRDTHVCIERDGCFRRSEVNYLAQGMWGSTGGGTGDSHGIRRGCLESHSVWSLGDTWRGVLVGVWLDILPQQKRGEVTCEGRCS